MIIYPIDGDTAKNIYLSEYTQNTRSKKKETERIEKKKICPMP